MDRKTLLREKITSTSIANVKQDVKRFIDNDAALDIWNEQYFLDLIGLIETT